MKEATLEKRLVRDTKRAGGLAIKLPAQWYRGIPDRMLLLPGSRIIFAELKTDTGKLSEPQYAFGKLLLGMGFKYCTIRGKRGLDKFTREQLNGKTPGTVRRDYK